jgi:peroxiredoxin
MAPGAVRVGTRAPDFVLPSGAAEGGSVSLEGYRGQACVVLVFLRNRG